jgi:hypothetical protein
VLVGSVFCLVMLATSSGIGLGLFSALRSGAAFPVISRIPRWVLVSVLVFLAIVSIRDRILARSGRAHGIARQLPFVPKQPVPVSCHVGARHAALVFAALGAGILLSVFEFTCACRVTLPTLAWLARIDRARGIGLMTLYNLGFVAPSIMVFVAISAVASSQRIGGLLPLHQGAVKIGLAGFLLGIAILLLVC